MTTSYVQNVFAFANPIFFLHSLDRGGIDRVSEGEALEVLRNLRMELRPLIGSPARITEQWTKKQKTHDLVGVPAITSAVHVFPVFCPELDAAMMLPLNIKPADNWNVDDLFLTFVSLRDGISTAHGALEELLTVLENSLFDWHGTRLYLRWRRAFSIRTACAIHPVGLSGRSHELPLVVSLLRAICQSPSTARGPESLPLGETPVFCTGTLERDGTFGVVGAVKEKLSGFVREYGAGLPAVLTRQQIDELEHTELLDKVESYPADNLGELFQLPSFSAKLQALSEPPRETERHTLLELYGRLSGSLRFCDVENAAQWLREGDPSPFYRFQSYLQEAEVLLHRGSFLKAKSLLDEAAQILDSSPHLFGASERAMLLANYGTLHFDRAEPEAVLAAIVRFTELDRFAHLSPKWRVHLLGTACQLLRQMGQWDEAVNYGKRAVVLADQVLASDAARDRNYLIHALLRRATDSKDSGTEDLQWAAQLLEESENEWSPTENETARKAHFGFCLHYRAELQRLQGRPFQPPVEPPWQGYWGHPWMFVLLSAARNTANEAPVRKRAAEKLVGFSRTMLPGPPLFELFHHVYEVYAAVQDHRSAERPLEDVESWCRRMKEHDCPGWADRLSPAINTAKDDAEIGLEQLCDAIPYH